MDDGPWWFSVGPGSMVQKGRWTIDDGPWWFALVRGPWSKENRGLKADARLLTQREMVHGGLALV